MTQAFIPHHKGKDAFNDFVKSFTEKAEVIDGLNINVDEVINTLLLPRYESEAFMAAARITRLHAKLFNKLMQNLGGKGVSSGLPYTQEGKKLKYTPLAIPVVKVNNGNTSVKVRVFKNIPVNLSHVEQSDGELYTDTVTSDNIGDVSWEDPWALSKFFNDLTADMADPNKCKKWETTARSIKNVKAYVEISMSKYLADYTTLKKDGHNDAHIRDIAYGIEDMYLPIEIKFAETIAEYLFAYETGPSSCMKANSPSAEKWSRFYTETKDNTDANAIFHPILWYYHNPDVGLVYSESKGECSLRSIVFNIGDKKYYSHPYASNNSVKEKFTNEMDRLGYTYVDKNNKGSLTLTSEFEIPLIDVKKSTDKVMSLCPVPYLDAFNNSWAIHHNPDANTFVFTPQDEKDNTPIPKWHTSTTGYLTPKTLKVQICYHCGDEVRLGGEIMTENGTLFCSKEHANVAGYVRALDSERMYRYILKAAGYEDYLGHIEGRTDRYFTNLDAAIKNGALPVMTCNAIPEDNSMISMYGHKVKYGEKFYKLSESDINNIKRTDTKYDEDGHEYFEIISLSSSKISNISIEVRSGEFRIEA